MPIWPGLAASEFEVRYNGVVQSVELVDHAVAPASVLVFDSSQSVAGLKLTALRAAVVRLIGARGRGPGGPAGGVGQHRSLYMEDQRAPETTNTVVSSGLLHLVAEETAGRAWGLAAASDIDTAFSEIAREARARYLLRVSAHGGGDARPVPDRGLAAARSGDVRSRHAYFVPEPGASVR